MKFITEDFILRNEYAKTLFHKYAKGEPIFDFHCHLEAEEIYRDDNFNSITQAWLGGDHYKWRAMRAAGVDERYITGDASDEEKFQKWAEVVPQLIGNPLYHWTHMELKNFFGVEEALTEENAKEIYEICNAALKTKEFSKRNLILKSNVTALCTTNDPVEDLQYHKLLQQEGFSVDVYPAFRPDKALNIESDGFSQYAKQLEEVCQCPIRTFEDIEKALASRLDYFILNGAVATDHAFEYVPFHRASESELNDIVERALKGEALTEEEICAYKTELMIFLGKLYAKKNVVMEIHVGALRNNNSKMFEQLGPDTGYDSIADHSYAKNLQQLLNAIHQKTGLPRTLLFTLNPKDYFPLATVAGSFQSGEEGIQRIQIGTSWWFLDYKEGMLEQMKVFSATSVFSKFVGMLTDSRSFLSYPRHEYFRRILCNYVGEIVERGEYPWDEERLGQYVKNICFGNAHAYLRGGKR